MLTDEQRSNYSEILKSLRLPADLEEFQILPLVMSGVLYQLKEDNTDQAVEIIEEAAGRCPVPTIRNQALQMLAEMSQRHNSHAAGALFKIFVQVNEPFACELIQKYQLKTTDQTFQALFFFLANNRADYTQIDPDFYLLTDYFLASGDDAFHIRVLDAARQMGFTNLKNTLEIFLQLATENIHRLTENFRLYNEIERKHCLIWLEKLALEGQFVAQEIICQLVLSNDDALARKIALKHNFAPKDDPEQAAFLFLTEQWQAYEAFDFSHRLLAAAYENASPSLRQRLLAHSRYSGQIGWLNAIPRTNRLMWLKDLSDADWQTTINQLEKSNRWNDLWRLTQAAPPFWSAMILKILQSVNFQPKEIDLFNTWCNLANLCLQKQPAITKVRSIFSNTPGITCLGLDQTGEKLVFGGPDANLYFLNLKHKDWHIETLISSASQSRAIAFSPDGSFIACASGDNQIRVYRTKEKTLAKLLGGHTGIIRSLTVHPDGRSLISSGFDGAVRTWRFPLGPEGHPITIDALEIFSSAFNQDGSLLISVGADRKVKIWKWPDGSLARELIGHADTITTLAVGRGQLLATFSRDSMLKIWNMVSGKQIREWNIPGVFLSHLCFHPDEKVIFGIDTHGVIYAWDSSTGVELIKIDHHHSPGTGLIFQEDRNLLISSSQNGELSLWDLETFILLRQPVGDSSPGKITLIENYLKQNESIPENKKWLEFVLNLYRWSSRFDVEIAEPVVLSLGEFDIQL